MKHPLWERLPNERRSRLDELIADDRKPPAIVAIRDTLTAGRRRNRRGRGVPALGDDVADIGPPDLEVLRASEAKNCDLLIEIGGRMDEVCENYHKVF